MTGPREVPKRIKLPNRRTHTPDDVIWTAPDRHEHRLKIGVGYYDVACRDPGEVFIRHAKSSSLMNAMLGDAAVLLSMLRQFGVPFHVIAASLARDNQQLGTSSSPIGAVALYLGAIERNGCPIDCVPDLKRQPKGSSEG